MIPRSEYRYEPIVMSVSMNEYGYRVVTLNLWPGATLSVTLTEQALDADQAKQAAIGLVENIMKLIRG